MLGDIHLDDVALAATLDGPLADCSRVVAVGDMLDRGSAAPERVFELLAARDAVVLCGNHELAYLGGPVYPGMREPAGRALAASLRDQVLDGRLVAAHAAGDVLCVHAGVSRAFWKEHLRDDAGSDVAAIARLLNRWFINGVLRRDFRHPVFAALEAPVRGPFWAHLEDDLLEPGLPPIRQAVGHTISRRRGWVRQAPGAVLPLNWGPDAPERLIGHAVVGASM